jgi:hypothetical protein
MKLSSLAITQCLELDLSRSDEIYDTNVESKILDFSDVQCI